MARVAAYVDGFNLYFGLKAKYGRKYLWLDLQALATSLLRPGQTLEQISYFTARVRNDPEGQQRQSDYLDALAVHSPLVSLVNGRFQEKDRRCHDCGARWTVYEEKETDVNIAAALIEDAVEGLYDTALLISADSDLCPAIYNDSECVTGFYTVLLIAGQVSAHPVDGEQSEPVLDIESSSATWPSGAGFAGFRCAGRKGGVPRSAYGPRRGSSQPSHQTGTQLI